MCRLSVSDVMLAVSLAWLGAGTDDGWGLLLVTHVGTLVIVDGRQFARPNAGATG